MFFLVLFVLTAGAELYEASLKSNYSLGSNLLVNPSFTSPTLLQDQGFHTMQVFLDGNVDLSAKFKMLSCNVKVDQLIA